MGTVRKKIIHTPSKNKKISKIKNGDCLRSVRMSGFVCVCVCVGTHVYVRNYNKKNQNPCEYAAQ